jgi:hypothetical protein
MYTVPVFVPEYKNTTQRDATDGVFSLTTTTVKTVTASSAINSLLAKYGGSSFRLETKQDLWHYAQQASGAVIFNFGAVFTAPMIGGNEWEYVLKREVNPYPGRIVKATFYVIPDADGSIVSAGERAERAFLDALQTLVLDTLSDETDMQRTTEGAGDLPNLSAATQPRLGTPTQLRKRERTNASIPVGCRQRRGSTASG